MKILKRTIGVVLALMLFIGYSAGSYLSDHPDAGAMAFVWGPLVVGIGIAIIAGLFFLFAWLFED